MKTLVLSIAMLAALASNAQSSYTLSTYETPYTPITQATVITSDDAGDGVWDDPLFVVPFGFDFQMNGHIYNSTFQFGLGAMMAFGSLNMEDSTLTDPVLNVFGFFDDIIDGNYIEGLPGSEISYTVTNDPGNHIAKIQYKDAAFYDEFDSLETFDNRINFQLWFYENGGILEIHFGPSNITDPDLIYEDNGPLVAVILGLNFDTDDMDYAAVINGDPTNPTLYEDFSEESDSLLGMNSTPLPNRVYRLTPSQASGVSTNVNPQFSVYPTLANNDIWVKSDLIKNQNYRILDISGKQVQTGQLHPSNSLKVSGLKPGLYFLSIDGMESLVKFIKK